MSARSPQSDKQIAAWNAMLAADPQYQQLLQALNTGYQGYAQSGFKDPTYAKLEDQFNELLLAKGIDPKRQGLEIGKDGSLRRDHTNRNVALGLAAIVGGGYALSTLPAVSGAASAPAAGAGAAGAGAGAAGAGAGAAGAGTLGSLAVGAIPGGISAVSNYFSNRANTNANRDATQAQLEAENRAAELEAKSAAELLAFQREQEAQRHAEWQTTQDRNYGLEQDRLGRLAPFRRAGVGSLGQLLQPLRQRA